MLPDTAPLCLKESRLMTKKNAAGNPLRKASSGRKPAASTDLKIAARPADGAGLTAKVPAPPEFGPELFFNRELSWLQFNRRVLHEAGDARNPLLERVKFAAIAGSNLDEFFMKRVGGLKQQIGARVVEVSVDGRTPEQQLSECFLALETYQNDKDRIISGLFKELSSAGIELLDFSQLSDAEKTALCADYYDNIFPLITPQSMDPAHPFPFISNLSLNLLVSVRYPHDAEVSLARVKVPISAGAPRFVQVGTATRYVLLEEVMANNLDKLFPGMEVVACELFRVTRNANTDEYHERADDLLAVIESHLQSRKFAPIVRLQVNPSIDPARRGRLAFELGLNEEIDVFGVSGMMGLRDLWQIANLNLPQYKFPVHHPIDHPLLMSERNIFHLLRDHREVLLQHPYDSFESSVERFLQEAATDPKVRGIKMTLYRTSPTSRIIDYLIRAAQNGKQVAVVVELKARFDEEANIRLATRMEEAGIHVTYGVVGLKTHCKVILVIRQDYNGLRRYVHIGTGNYHPVTSRLYSDMGIFLYDREVCLDATELFNYLTTGFTPKRNYLRMLPAPKLLKKGLLERIQREIDLHSDKLPGWIRFKMNALEDVDIVKALYRASLAGVQVELIVRDSCRARPGLPGISENLRVISIVGRFLEHARIYAFGNGGDPEYLIGSADAMKRNLEARVEILVPIEAPELKLELNQFFEMQLKDHRNAWELQADGTYIQRQPRTSVEKRSCQELMIELARKRLHAATRLRRRKARTGSRRNLRE
jgi:polyphosphate kinase